MLQNIDVGNSGDPPAPGAATEALPLGTAAAAGGWLQQTTAQQQDVVPPQFALLELLNGMWIARAIHIVADLGIADLLVTGPRSIGELAASSGTDAAALRRLLSALATVAIFDEVEPGRFAQSARSGFLVTGRPGSVRNAAKLFGSTWQWDSWGALLHTIRTGEPAFEKITGVCLPRYLDEVDPAAGELFDAAMADMASFLDRAIVASFDFGSACDIVDVSGAHSQLLTHVLTACPAARGVLVDRPAVASRAADRIATSGLAERYRVVAADYLVEIPATGDLVVLNRVLHDWDDQRAIVLLNACRPALKPGGRVLIVEQVLGGGPAAKRAAFLDLQMMQLRGGAERTVDQYRELLTTSGFALVAVHETPSPMVIIEARLAAEHTTRGLNKRSAGTGGAP